MADGSNDIDSPDLDRKKINAGWQSVSFFDWDAFAIVNFCDWFIFDTIWVLEVRQYYTLFLIIKSLD